MKKHLLVVGIIFLFILSSVSPLAFGVNIQISKRINDGNTLYVGGSGSGNYTKIQDAIDNTSDGDTVFVYDDSAPYKELIIVDKSITLIGEDKNTTVIDGDYLYENCEIIRAIVGNVKITNFKLIRAGYGIVINDTTNVEIFNINVNNTECGIAVGYSSQCLVKNNFINDSLMGIALWSSTDSIVTNNYITDLKMGAPGVYIVYSQSNQIYDNVITFSRYGIEIIESSNNNIFNNTVNWNSCGIAISDSHDNNITDNIIMDNRGGGTGCGMSLGDFSHHNSINK